jgi:hypothetical protein
VYTLRPGHGRAGVDAALRDTAQATDLTELIADPALRAMVRDIRDHGTGRRRGKYRIPEED